MSQIICGTGHRVQDLTVFGKDIFSKRSQLAALETRLTDLARAYLSRHRPETVISGVAGGWDQALAVAALDLGIHVIAAVPFTGQESMWPTHVQKRYTELLSRCGLVHVVSEGGYSAAKMQVRNEWMVERASVVLALWKGTKGGTGNCVAYANDIERPVVNLYSQFQKHAGLDFIAPTLAQQPVTITKTYRPLTVY